MPYNIFTTKRLLNATNLVLLYKQYGGPLWAYEADIIKSRIAQLKNFDIIRFAQKACSNIHILRLMRDQGVKVDSVSIGEIERALLAGFLPGKDSEEIVFTADLLDEQTLSRIIELNIPVNSGSIDMLIQLGKRSPGHKIWLRINPGFGSSCNKKTNTGGENSKHGIWYTDIPIAIEYIHRYRLNLIGIHMHIGSGVDYYHLSQVCKAMVKHVISCGQNISSISAGGGLSIPYRETESDIDTSHYFYLWNSARQQISKYFGHPIRLEIEPGRFLVAESGVLIAQIRAIKDMGNHHFILVDVGFNDLIRPAMYGSYHHISLLPANGQQALKSTLRNTVIGGPLCESGDVFTQNIDSCLAPRLLPAANIGDYIIFHDTGAYGASMSSNYNTRPLLPEVLFEQGNVRQIRRRQQLDELFNLEI